jgi:hypothetical protein
VGQEGDPRGGWSDMDLPETEQSNIKRTGDPLLKRPSVSRF